MFERLYISVIHPTKIGLFVKDKLWVPFIYILSFFVIALGMLALKTFQTNFFDPSPAREAIPIIVDATQSYDVKFENGKLSGQAVRVETPNYELYFNADSVSRSYSYPTFLFKENNVAVGYMLEVVTYTYEELGYKLNFKFENIKNNSGDDAYNFSILLDKLCDKFNPNYQRASFIVDAIYIVVMIAVYFGAALLFSYFTNPDINMPIRAKLCLYDIIISIFFIHFSIAFSASWLIYLGIITSIWHARWTFSRIIKIKLRG